MKKLSMLPETIVMTSRLPQTPVSDIDYLDADPEIQGQRFMCVSMITPTADMCKEACHRIAKKHWASIKNKTGPNGIKRVIDAWEDLIKLRRGFKVRGCYDTMEQATARTKEISKFDRNHHVFISEVGKWACFGQTPESAQQQKYMHDELNTIMEAHERERIKAAKDFNERRRAMMEREVEKQIKAEEEAEARAEDPNAELTHLDASRYAIQYKIDQKTKDIQRLQRELDEAQAKFKELCGEHPDYVANVAFETPDTNPLISKSTKSLVRK